MPDRQGWHQKRPTGRRRERRPSARHPLGLRQLSRFGWCRL